ncbi:MAG: hypothetical protein JSS61_03215 [Verrucomicrobia bacterium]|nr:hypothetical protein [Verrucomicrobiota bacterium]
MTIITNKDSNLYLLSCVLDKLPNDPATLEKITALLVIFEANTKDAFYNKAAQWEFLSESARDRSNKLGIPSILHLVDRINEADNADLATCTQRGARFKILRSKLLDMGLSLQPGYLPSTIKQLTRLQLQLDEALIAICTGGSSPEGTRVPIVNGLSPESAGIQETDTPTIQAQKIRLWLENHKEALLDQIELKISKPDLFLMPPEIASYLPKIQSLQVDKTPLRRIDFSFFPELERATLNETNIKNICIIQSKKLKHLDVSRNLIDEIKIQESSKLESLSIDRNPIKAIDLSSQYRLTSLRISEEQILGISNLPRGSTLRIGILKTSPLGCGNLIVDTVSRFGFSQIQRELSAGRPDESTMPTLLQAVLEANPARP